VAKATSKELIEAANEEIDLSKHSSDDMALMHATRANALALIALVVLITKAKDEDECTCPNKHSPMDGCSVHPPEPAHPLSVPKKKRKK